MKRAFVTGSTGFLGSHFLVNFVGNGIDHAYLQIRGEDASVRDQKLRSALTKASRSYLSGPASDQIVEQSTTVSGDIAVPNFGISSEDLGRLREAGLDEFWHFAASLNFEEYRKDHIRTANVDGALNAIAVCRELGIKTFVYVSTAYTCGVGNGVIPEVLHNLERPFSNFYEESKCNAEHLVTQACAEHGISLVILRPSVVVGNSETKRPGGSDTGLYGFLRELSRLKLPLQGTTEITRLFGMQEGEVNFVPVNLLMQDVRTIMAVGLENGAIFHLSSSANPSVPKLLQLICEQLGIDNLMLAEKTGDDDLSTLERALAKKTIFYSNYMNACKQFERKLPSAHTVTEDDLRAYVIEGLRDMAKEDVDSLFTRCHVQTSDGIALNVFSAGDPSNDTVLLCNAVGMPAEFLRPLAEELAERHHVLTWESRGLPSAAHGPRDLDVSLDRQALDAVTVLDHFGIEAASVVGWCTGARLAMRLSANHPSRVTAAAYLNGGYNLAACAKTIFEKSMITSMPKIATDMRYAALFHKSIFSQMSDKTAQAEVSAQRASNSLMAATNAEYLHLSSIPFHTSENLYRYARLIAAYLEEDVREDEVGRPVPTLVLSGSQDVTTSPQSSRLMADRMPNARYAEIADGDHFALYGNPDFRKAVTTFIGEAQECQA